MVRHRSCDHLQLTELALGIPRSQRGWEIGTTGSAAAIATIASQQKLLKLELIAWDKVADCSALQNSSVQNLSLINCSFEAYYELLGGASWNSVTHLHCKDNLKPMELRGLSGDFLFVKFLGCPTLKSVSGSSWIIRRLAEVCERLNDDSLTPSGFQSEAAYLKNVKFY